MYAITEGVAKINGEIVDTFEREISDGRTALEVEAGTTGFVGEDCRNAGGRTYIGINCICGDFYFEPVKNDNGQISGHQLYLRRLLLRAGEERQRPDLRNQDRLLRR